MKLNNSKLFRILALCSGTLLSIATGGQLVVNSNSSAINAALNVSTYKLVKDETSTIDSEYFKSDYKDASDGGEALSKLKEHADEVGKDIEREGAVLLKNENNALPLKANDKVSLLGQGSVKINYSGSGSSSTNTSSYVDFDTALKSVSLDTNQTVKAFYEEKINSSSAKYGRKEYNTIYLVNEVPLSEFDDATKSSITTYNDAAIVVLSRNAGEGSNVSPSGSDTSDGSYLSLSDEEKELFAYLGELKKSGSLNKIVVLLNSAVTIQTDFLFDDSYSIDACMWIGNVGSQGLYGVADLLVGNYSPSGKLNDTFLKDNFSSPAMKEWSYHSINSNNAKLSSQRYSNYRDANLDQTQRYYETYLEGIYVGYRYYETRYEDSILNQGNAGDFDYDEVVSYPFGYGLSYAEFEYSDYSVINNDDDTYTVSVKVTNIGNTYSGKEVVEVYLQKPYTEYDKEHQVEKASVELVGFSKTSTLKPGGSETVSITISKEEFKSYDSNYAKTYILDSGDYYLTVASDAHDAINNILAKKANKTSLGDSNLTSVVLSQTSLDTKTYSISKETNKEIKNQLDFMDINKYEGRGDNSVTYVSRSDWENTFPKNSVTLTATDKMIQDLKSNKTIEDDDSLSLPTYGANNGLQLINLRNTEEVEIKYDDEIWDTLLDEMTYEEQVNLLTQSAFNTPAVASIGKPKTNDHDGPVALTGTGVTSPTNTLLPCEGLWASSYNVDLVKSIGDLLAEDCLAADTQSLYAPGVNIHRTSFGGRLAEYFSEDSYLTGIMASSEVKGMQNKGVIPTIKHFAFNEEEDNRNGVCVWLNEQEAREIMLKPFEMALRPSKGNGHAMMSSFNRAGCIWTGASRELQMNIVRDEYGFDGYFITDMADSNGAYMTYDDGIYNGTDIFLGNGKNQEVMTSLKENKAYCQRMREACHRVLYVVCNYSSAMNGIDSLTKVVTITPWYNVLFTSLIISSGVISLSSIGLVIVTYITRMKEE